MVGLRNDKISVTVVTGFLGSGKTTFINSVLRKYPDVQFALVENEFGSVSVDTKLIKGVDASQLFELKQGCICCTITNEYELVLQELAERFPHVEHLLIETTGIADPAGVVRPFFREERLKELYAFNKTICLADALNFGSGRGKDISYKQLAIADEVVVTKSENSSSSEREKFRGMIAELNPLAPVRFAENGVVETFSLQSLPKKIRYFTEPRTGDLHSKVKTHTWTCDRALNKADFTRRISYYLDVYKKEIYRVKGFLCFENEPFEFVFQGVGGNFEISEGESLVEADRSTLVFIGELDGLSIELT
ncbi:GTPase, G3E family [Mariniphaga anaerophila]|uniref:GTPase, G3E family n=1 Tax=Mariniphaga anaerophila TaxID=1484053 RepID=A0A1M5A5H3_9BACT|nr:GTP-binding protein [Mariniphaga anaerophila]SHF25569.1 GTPase, G3E family [Mariniphaga anaerophila]